MKESLDHFFLNPVPSIYFLKGLPNSRILLTYFKAWWNLSLVILFVLKMQKWLEEKI